MRRLGSKEDEEKKKKRNRLVLSVILVAVIVLSSLGFAFQNKGIGTDVSGNQSQVTYNGFKFTNQNGLWILGNFVFNNLPTNVPDIGNITSQASYYQGQPVYVYSEDSSARIELAANMAQIALRVQDACPENTNCSGDFPVKTCDNNFIIIQENNFSDIKQEGNCIFIQGQKQELVGLVDQFLFKILGIR